MSVKTFRKSKFPYVLDEMVKAFVKFILRA